MALMCHATASLGLARGGVRFAWIKASEGTTGRDAEFAVHADGAAAAGVAWGPYHF